MTVDNNFYDGSLINASNSNGLAANDAYGLSGSSDVLPSNNHVLLLSIDGLLDV